MTKRLRVCILHANRVEKDFRLKKTVYFFSKYGAEVTIVTFPWNKVSNPDEWPCDFVYCGAQTYPIKPSNNKRWILRVLFNIVFMSPQKCFSKLFSPGFGLGKEALKINADLYYVVNIETVKEGLRILKKKSVPIIYDAYELFPRLLKKDFYFRNRKKSNQYYRFEKSLVNHSFVSTIVVNEEIADKYYIEYGCKRPNIIYNVAPEVVDKPEIHDGITFYFQSYLRPTYNIEGLIDAFSRIRGDAKLVIQGEFFDESYKMRLTQHISSSQRFEDISLLPACEYEDVVQSASRFDVGVDPINSKVNGVENESFRFALANKFFTYISAGLCVASSFYPVQKRFIDEHKCGITFDPNNADEFVGALQYLVDHPEEVKNMKNCALKLAQEINIYTEQEKFVQICEGALASIGALVD